MNRHAATLLFGGPRVAKVTSAAHFNAAPCTRRRHASTCWTEETALTIIEASAAPKPHRNAGDAGPATASPAGGQSALRSGVLDSLDDAKAEDILAIDLQGKTSLADTMVIATGRSTTHVGAIADRVVRACKDAGIAAKVEGLANCDWVLVDASDIIVHIFRPEVRQFYNLEKMWGVDRPDEKRADRPTG